MQDRKQATSESASAPVTQRGNESCLEIENSPMRSDLISDLAGRPHASNLKTAAIDPPAVCPSENDFSITGQSPHTDPMSGWPDNSTFKRPACLLGRMTRRGRLGITKTCREKITITLFLIFCCLRSYAAKQVVDGQHGGGVFKLGAVSLLNTNAIICLDAVIEGYKET